MEVTVIRTNRKTVAIQVNSDLSVTVRAPRRASQKDIEQILKEKDSWIQEHINQIKCKKVQYDAMKVEHLTNAEIQVLTDKALKYIPERVTYFARHIGVDYGISIGIGEDGKPYVSTNDSSKISTNRLGKGKSIIDFPTTYVVVDIETTGLSPAYDEIIEISAIRYEDNQEKNKYVSLVKPSFEIDEYITELTGITNEMLVDAPSIEHCIKAFKEFIGSDLLVGYNVNFDINFLYDNLMNCYGESLSNDYIDVMRIAKRALPELGHHRQKDIINYYNIVVEVEHRAEADCIACKACFDALKEDIKRRNIDISVKNKSHKGISAKDISTEKTNFDTEHPLFGKLCVFTGTLEKMQRKEAMQIVADLGGIPGDSVTKKTNYLVLGNNDYCKTIKDGKSSKQKKAEKMILEGADLQIISEQVFYDMILEE